MAFQETSGSSTTEGLPVAPSMGPGLAQVKQPRQYDPVDRRVLMLSALAVLLGISAALIARLLTGLIHLITNVAWFSRISLHPAEPAESGAGWLLTLLIPVGGALVVGVMARYGSSAIRGHGIPEAMEQVLLNQSRIPLRMTFLKPLSSAIAIGTGGPFGAEGPIIATGGAIGSAFGQWLHVTADERKVLLAMGAAAGMSAIFGAPVSAVLLAIELLLFEFRPRSVIPVALATTTAAAARWTFEGRGPMFAMPHAIPPDFGAMWLYILIGAALGVGAVAATRAVYWIEDHFERLPIHWMWWPAIGAVAVGAVGILEPRVLGVGYERIEDMLNGRLLGTGLLVFVGLKFLAWSVALGSGTSGGTLAPLFMIGGGIGASMGTWLGRLFPTIHMDPRIGALVGMAAIFAGASRALLTSVVFAFEITLQPLGLLPLLGGCTAAYLVSSLLMRTSIMTEKIARRGIRVPSEYTADYLDRVPVERVGVKSVQTLSASATVAQARALLDTVGGEKMHQGYPVVDGAGNAVGVLTLRDLLAPERTPDSLLGQLIHRPPVVVFRNTSLREAADLMVVEDIGRLVVVESEGSMQPIGILTRSDLLRAHAPRLDAELKRSSPGFNASWLKRR